MLANNVQRQRTTTLDGSVILVPVNEYVCNGVRHRKRFVVLNLPGNVLRINRSVENYRTRKSGDIRDIPPLELNVHQSVLKLKTRLHCEICLLTGGFVLCTT